MQNEMKKYTNPEIEVVEVKASDIITTSPDHSRGVDCRA